MEGSLRNAKKHARFKKYEPYTAVRGLLGAVQHGAGVDLADHFPRPTSPDVPRKLSDLEDKGALVLLSDQEKAQLLDSAELWLFINRFLPASIW